MSKLSQFAASVGAALVCAAVPASFNWSPANTTLFSLDMAEARVGRPLTATSVAGVSRRVHRRGYRRAAVGAAAVGAAAYGVGSYYGGYGYPASSYGSYSYSYGYPGYSYGSSYGYPAYGYGGYYRPGYRALRRW